MAIGEESHNSKPNEYNIISSGSDDAGTAGCCSVNPCLRLRRLPLDLEEWMLSYGKPLHGCDHDGD